MIASANSEEERERSAGREPGEDPGRLLDRGQGGRHRLIEGPTAAEPLVLAVYEEVLKAGGLPVVALSLEGQLAALLRATPPTPSSSGSRRFGVGRRGGRLPDRDRRRHQHPRALRRSRPERQTRASRRLGELMETTMARAAEGEHRWVYTIFPTNAYASDAEMSLADFEDFYFRACLADDPRSARRLGQGLARSASAWPSGPRAARRSASRRRGTDITLGIEGRTFIPCDGDHNMPDGEFFTGPVEDSVEGEVSFHLPAMIGGREVAGVRLRFEVGQGRRRDGRARRGVPDRAARHRRGRPPPRRARDRHQLRDRPRHPRRPARREDRRHRPPGGRRQLSRSPAASTRAPSTPTWSATCVAAARSRSTASCFRRTAASSSEPRRPD